MAYAAFSSSAARRSTALDLRLLGIWPDRLRILALRAIYLMQLMVCRRFAKNDAITWPRPVVRNHVYLKADRLNSSTKMFCGIPCPPRFGGTP